MAKPATTKKARKPRNRAAQDVTLINLRALKRGFDNLWLQVSFLNERVSKLERKGQ